MAAPLLPRHTCALVIRVLVSVVVVSSVVNRAGPKAQTPHESLQICRKMRQTALDLRKTTNASIQLVIQRLQSVT